MLSLLCIISSHISTLVNFILHGYLFVQVIGRLDQGILGGEVVLSMQEGKILKTTGVLLVFLLCIHSCLTERFVKLLIFRRWKT
jgi:hypothetical protein